MTIKQILPDQPSPTCLSPNVHAGAAGVHRRQVCRRRQRRVGPARERQAGVHAGVHRSPAVRPPPAPLLQVKKKNKKTEKSWISRLCRENNAQSFENGRPPHHFTRVPLVPKRERRVDKVKQQSCRCLLPNTSLFLKSLLLLLVRSATSLRLGCSGNSIPTDYSFRWSFSQCRLRFYGST